MDLHRILALTLLGLFSINSVAPAMDKVVCYYGTWATYRNGIGKVTVEDIDPNLCTHIIYTFVGIQTSGKIQILDSWLDIDLKGFARFNNLKQKNPNLKTLLAIGGWNEGSIRYSQVASSASTRKVLIDSAIDYCKTYGFDGFDLDWEYPAQRGGSTADKANFVNLIKEMRQAFDKEGLILTAAVAVSPTSSAISYDIPSLTTYLHFVNLMMYDLHGSWEPLTGGNAPLYAGSWETTQFQRELNVDACVSSWIARGANPSKLVMGLGFYGQTFTLQNTANNKPNAPATGPGRAGSYTQQSGFLGYNEICEKLQQGGWTTVMEPQQKFVYSYSGNQWVGYDDPQSLLLKLDYAKSKGLGGAMIWSIETDDVKGACGPKYVLLKTIANYVLGGNPNPTQATTTTTTSTTTTSATTTSTTKAPSTGTTKPTTTITTTTASGATPPGYPDSLCTEERYIRDPTNCSIFYYCQKLSSGYRALAFNCGSGLAYDEKANTCDYKANVPGCN